MSAAWIVPTILVAAGFVGVRMSWWAAHTSMAINTNVRRFLRDDAVCDVAEAGEDL